MTTVNERVKEFLENWQETHCAACQGLLSDGNFIMIDGRLYCLDCHDSKLKADTENGHGRE